MTVYAIYGKRTGLKVNGIPIQDKQFRALNYSGVRVSKLSDAGTYAERSDAEDVYERRCKQYADEGLVKYEIRPIK